tara:strand:+ start:9216 stop:10556 length:1341 start_codon:yes stop_codon:yes gene_type:complete
MLILVLLIALILTPMGVNAQQEKDTLSASTLSWTLEESIKYALEHNLTVKQAGLDQENATLNYEQSKYERLPGISGSVSQRWSNGSTIDPITSIFINQKSSSTSLGINSNVTLFNGFQISNTIRQNALLAEQSEFLLEETKNSIQLSVMEAYIQALYSKEAVAIAETQLASSAKELEQAKGLFEGRSLTLKDLNDIQSQHANNQYNLINTRAGYQQQLLTLKQLLELDGSVNLELVAPADEFASDHMLSDTEDIYNTALQFLPEVSASRTNIKISGTSLDIAKAGLYPSLSLSGSVSSGYTKAMGLSFTDQIDGNFSQSLGLSLSVPIFNKRATSTNIQQAKIGIKQAELNYETTRKEVYRKIETAWLNATSYKEQMAAAEISREAARSSYDLARAQFNVGELTATELIVAQTALNTAELNYLQARYLTLLYAGLIEFYQGKPITL